MPSPVNVSHLTADDWDNAFVTGNGRQGAACYGGPDALRVTLSHERLFLPVHEPLEPPDTGGALGRLRDLLYGQQFQAAADEVVALAITGDPRYAQLRQSDPFVGAATLCFIPGQRTAATGTPQPPRTDGWRRSVDFESGVVTQQWGGYRQDVFVSRVHDLVAIRISGDERVSGRLHLGPIAGAPPAPVECVSTADAGRLQLAATFPARWPGALPGYTVTCDVHLGAGSTSVGLGGTSLYLHDAHDVLLIARTVLGPPPDRTPQPDFDRLLAAHTRVHRALFDRCRLDLGGKSTDSDVLVEDVIGTATPHAIELLFDAGRYNIISASGTLPPNLQGVWSGTFDPAWRGGYTFDGNLAAALAAAGPTGTPELLRPLFDLLDAHAADFRTNAERLYRLPGILVPPHLTAHGRHNHFTERWCLTFWTGGAAWLARLYYDYWRFTGDREFLRERALPFLRAAATFYAGFVSEREGGLCFAPSYSPENSPFGEMGPQACVNATMDTALLRDLLTNLLAGTAADGRADPDEPRWRDLLSRLPGYRVDPDGALAEWLWPVARNNHAHRHASHLYGLWYEPDPALLDQPELRAAAITTVRRRLHWWRDNGDEMAFGLVQLGLAAACLGLAEEAHEIVSQLATRYWRTNLVSTHNAGHIFNTDICGGLPALVTSMLVNSRGNVIRLLPALPSAWRQGSIQGALVRGGVRVQRLSWSAERIEAELVVAEDRELTVWAGDRFRLVRSARAGQVLRLDFPAINR